MIGIADSYLVSHFMNFEVGGQKQVGGYMDTSSVQILHGRDSEGIAEFSAETIFADVKTPGKFLKRIAFGKIGVK